MIINKIDLADLVGASLEVMDLDAKKMRGDRPFYFTNLKAGQGVAEIAEFIIELGGLEKRTSKIIAGEYENLQLNQLQNG